MTVSDSFSRKEVSLDAEAVRRENERMENRGGWGSRGLSHHETERPDQAERASESTACVKNQRKFHLAQWRWDGPQRNRKPKRQAEPRLDTRSNSKSLKLGRDLCFRKFSQLCNWCKRWQVGKPCDSPGESDGSDTAVFHPCLFRVSQLEQASTIFIIKQNKTKMCIKEDELYSVLPENRSDPLGSVC